MKKIKETRKHIERDVRALPARDLDQIAGGRLIPQGALTGAQWI